MERENNTGISSMCVESLCPICLNVVEAFIVEENDQTLMRKTCQDHGSFETVVWRGKTPMREWMRTKQRAYVKKPMRAVEKGCPYDCGLCEAHRQHTCTALIEVTSRCNLHCRFCFADALDAPAKEPSLENLRMRFERILEVSGTCNIQLSGGEPTVRDDLAKIIAMGKALGFPFIQVNTNGLRLAHDENYVKDLKEAGLSSVFLQFDGTNDTIYEALRGKALLNTKRQAIENCRKYGIGVVLVPTIVPKINVENIGEIVRFAMQHSPSVRGVHFQPVSYFGRFPNAPKDEDRITLGEVMDQLVSQSEGMIALQNLQPPGCENALCSFNGNFLIQEGKLLPVTKRTCCSSNSPSSAEEGANKAKAFVARNWAYQKASAAVVGETKLSDWDAILNAIADNTFTLSGMAFQDVWNVNLERIRDCCIHVSTLEGNLVPFCAYNITDSEGRSLYRETKETL
jgi:hypothetical protein